MARAIERAKAFEVRSPVHPWMVVQHQTEFGRRYEAWNVAQFVREYTAAWRGSRHMYEAIFGPLRAAYVDAEFKRSPTLHADVDGLALTREFASLLVREIAQTFSLPDDGDALRVLLFDASSDTKFSVHVHVVLCDSSLAFANMMVVKSLVESVLAKSGARFDVGGESMIDQSVYSTTTRLMRMPGSSKREALDRVLRRVDGKPLRDVDVRDALITAPRVGDDAPSRLLGVSLVKLPRASVRALKPNRASQAAGVVRFNFNTSDGMRAFRRHGERLRTLALNIASSAHAVRSRHVASIWVSPRADQLRVATRSHDCELCLKTHRSRVAHYTFFLRRGEFVPLCWSTNQLPLTDGRVPRRRFGRHTQTLVHQWLQLVPCYEFRRRARTPRGQ